MTHTCCACTGCACHAHHGEEKTFWAAYRWLAAAAALFIAALFMGKWPWVQLAFCVVSWGIAGREVVFHALRGLIKGDFLDENFLMTLATVGAFCLGEYPEAAAVMLFYQIGEAFQERAAGNSRRSIRALLALRPAFARVWRGGAWQKVAPEDVKVGEVIAVYPGERVPLDGTVTDGAAFADTSALTGESVPKRLEPGDTALGGFVCKDGKLTLQVARVYGQSATAKVLELVEHAAGKKARAEKFISRFARWYTPLVVAGAVLVAVVPPLLVPDATFKTWVSRALVFLVVSCPCALVLSVPLGFFGGIGGAAKNGILIKGGNFVEALARLKILAADKTGTLTKGVFKVTAVAPLSCTAPELLEICALAEAASNHPVAAALRVAYGKPVEPARVKDVREIAGKGVSAQVDGQTVLVGKAAFLLESGISVPPQAAGSVFCAQDGKYIGSVTVSDEIKADAAQAVQTLKKEGIEKIILLTGDNAAAAEPVAKALQVDGFRADLLPAQKVAQVERLQQQTAGTVAFVGDGINDAPVLARADVGIAMGALGSDAAVEAADVVLMTDEPLKIAQAVALARFTLKVVRQNIVFALAVKAAILALGAGGAATLWEAVFADVGVSVVAVLNAIRPLKYQPKEK